MIELILRDINFNKVKLIDEYSSLIWCTRYYTSGDFEIVLPSSAENMKLFRENCFITREDDENVGEIDTIKDDIDEDRKETLIIKGKFVSGSILKRRVISKQTSLYGKLNDVVLKLLNEYIINPEDQDRQIQNFITNIPAINKNINTQFTGQTVLEAIEELCEENKVGFKIIRNEDNWEFSLYEGLNRTYSQNENIRCIFSDELENLATSSYLYDKTTVANSIYVAGEGEGENRIIKNVSKTKPKGLQRYEKWLDKRDVKSDNMQPQEYGILLGSIGFANLQDEPIETFDGTVYFDNIVYKKEVNVGDVVVVENEKWGKFVNVRLVEVIESVDESGQYSIIPKFDI